MRRYFILAAIAALAFLAMPAFAAAGMRDAYPAAPPCLKARDGGMVGRFDDLVSSRTRDRAFEARERDFRCLFLVSGLPSEGIAKAMDATARMPARRHVAIKNGAALVAVVLKNGGDLTGRHVVTLAFVNPPIAGKDTIAFADEWRVRIGHDSVIIARIYCGCEDCGPSTWAIIEPPKSNAVIKKVAKIIIPPPVANVRIPLPPPSGQEACSPIRFRIPHELVVKGAYIRYALITNGELPRTGCNERVDGNRHYSPTHPCDNCSYGQIVYKVQQALRDKRYGARYTFLDTEAITSEDQEIIVQRAAENSAVIAVCLFVPGMGESDAYLIVPPGVTIPANMLAPVAINSHWENHTLTIQAGECPKWGMGAVLKQR